MRDKHFGALRKTVGEWSKRIGEKGEDVSDAFLEQIGWGDSEQGFDIPCLKASKHSEKGTRTSHGIDRLFVTATRWRTGS